MGSSAHLDRHITPSLQPLVKPRQSLTKTEHNRFMFSKVQGFVGAKARRVSLIEQGEKREAIGYRHLAKQSSFNGLDPDPFMAKRAQVLQGVIIHRRRPTLRRLDS